MIKYAIIDDEPIAHEIIEGFANELQQLEKGGNCYNAFEAIELLQKAQIDLLFLDINMPKISGFELIRTLPNPPMIIITSAYKEFAIDGYEFDVVDYLLKPFSFERFVKAVNKVLFLKSKPASKKTEQIKHIFIKGDKKQHQVDTEDILFIEALGNYCKVFLEDEMIVTLKKISEFEKELPSNFIRIHNSFIVSKNKIKTIDGNKANLKEHTIPIGQTYKSVIKKLYNP